MDLLVVGAGSMGRWLASVLREDAPNPVSLSFFDTDSAAAIEAADRVGGRVIDPDGTGAFDAVCVAVPLPAAAGAIASHASRAERAVFDVTGTMRDPLDAMAEHAPDCERASFHPLFAPANEPGNVPVVVDESGSIVDAVRGALETRGNRVFETTAAEHDRAMETVQARTHAAVLAFGLAAGDVDPAFHTPVSADLAGLVEQVAGGEPRVYADVQAAFDGASDVATAADRLATADHAAFEELYETIGERTE
jgi:prephenate dehydrogenase